MEQQVDYRSSKKLEEVDVSNLTWPATGLFASSYCAPPVSGKSFIYLVVCLLWSYLDMIYKQVSK